MANKDASYTVSLRKERRASATELANYIFSVLYIRICPIMLLLKVFCAK